MMERWLQGKIYKEREDISESGKEGGREGRKK